jgi:hypothetical protein
MIWGIAGVALVVVGLFTLAIYLHVRAIAASEGYVFSFRRRQPINTQRSLQPESARPIRVATKQPQLADRG